MNSIFVVKLFENTNEIVPLHNIDLEKNVEYLKDLIATEFQYDVKDFDLVFNGTILDKDLLLSEFIKSNDTVHCIRKTKKYKEYVSPTDIDIEKIGDLFTLIAHIQISVTSRVNILQKILTQYPEFRRNLGAQAFIRDSVLFNTLHQPEVIKNIAKTYPIICDAAPFIVDTIKKELARNTSILNYSEPATDSTTSSEEENSLGASGSSSDVRRNTSGTLSSQSENASIRQISRQQLQSALAQIGFGSVNSLSNIAQRNTDTMQAESSAASQNSSTNSNDRITSDVFRSQLDRVFSNLQNRQTQQMEVTESTGGNSDDASDIPNVYRTHQYAEQLRTMAQMGFTNHDENLSFLTMSNGNIENAINLLMGGMN